MIKRKPLYHYIIKRVLVSYVYNFVRNLYAQCFHHYRAVYLCTRRRWRRGVCCPVTLNICLLRGFLLWCALYV